MKATVANQLKEALEDQNAIIQLFDDALRDQTHFREKFRQLITKKTEEAQKLRENHTACAMENRDNIHNTAIWLYVCMMCVLIFGSDL